MVKLITFTVVVALIGLVRGEPKCSRFDYEEKLLEKMIRMEVEMEKKSDEYKDLQSRISYMLQQVNDERKDLEKEKENMQVRRTHLFLIKHHAFLCH